MVESLQNFGYGVFPWVTLALLYYINSNIEQVLAELRRIRRDNAKSLKRQELIVSTLCDDHDHELDGKTDEPILHGKKPLEKGTASAFRILPFLPNARETLVRQDSKDRLDP
jgi:hypothetical protein